ncbi:MAG: hypothetical protein H6963_12670 [Chromatiaceae bacterium]|nr:hypothetical protein [Chromatiaceae bacterium]
MTVQFYRITQTALKRNAAACVLAHNHPSGVAEPSQADRNITQRIKDALTVVNVRNRAVFLSTTGKYAPPFGRLLFKMGSLPPLCPTGIHPLGYFLNND